MEGKFQPARTSFENTSYSHLIYMAARKLPQNLNLIVKNWWTVDTLVSISWLTPAHYKRGCDEGFTTTADAGDVTTLKC